MNQEPIALSSNDAAIMAGLKQKLGGILECFDTSRRVVFFDYPIYLNLGDLLINLATEHFFASNRIHLWRRYSVFDMPASIPGIDDSVVIVCQGGGNLGDLHPIFQNGRERVLRLYPRNPIVILPQSVHFQSPLRLQQSMEQLRSHRNCYVFARDEKSLEILKRAGIHRSSAMPDMAHFLWGDIHPDQSVKLQAEPMRLARTGKESRASSALLLKANGAKTWDWLDIVGANTYRFAQLIMGAIKLQSSLGLHTQKYWQWRPIEQRAIRDAVRFFSRYRSIYTDRLHAVLLGLLLEREVNAFDNCYGKLSSYRDTWLGGIESLHWNPGE